MARLAPKHPLISQFAASKWTALGVALAGLVMATQAQAQMVPRARHALQQTTNNANLTAVRVDFDADDTEVSGHGLNLHGQGFWPHWEGRIGAAIDRPVNPLKDSFVLAQPIQGGLHVRSMHVLSDYYIEGGFRATAGLLRGETGQGWWSSGDIGGGLNISLQRVDSLGLLGAPNSQPSADGNGQQTMPYLGAGYTSRLSINGAPSSWRINADLGFMSINASKAFQSNKSLDGVVHDMGFRPIAKVSVGYSF